MFSDPCCALRYYPEIEACQEVKTIFFPSACRIKLRMSKSVPLGKTSSGYFYSVSYIAKKVFKEFVFAC